MVTIKFIGVDKVTKYFIGLPKKIDKELDMTNNLFMRRVKKSAKLRAPRDTGRLAESIQIIPTKTKGKIKQYAIEVEAEHGIYQELGFRPHWAPILNSSKMAPGIYFVKKNTPFLVPAVDAQLVSYSQKLNLAMNRAIR